MNTESAAHDIRTFHTEQGDVYCECSCGWQSRLFAPDRTMGGADALQRAREAGDLHTWDTTLGPR